MSLRRQLSRRLSNSLGLGLGLGSRFSKSRASQPELLERLELPQTELHESHEIDQPIVLQQYQLLESPEPQEAPSTTSDIKRTTRDELRLFDTTHVEEELAQGLQEPVGRVEASRWSLATTTGSSEYSSTSSLEAEEQAHRTYEEKLTSWKEFFDNGPLVRCLDTAKDRELFQDLLFDTLLSEVKEPGPLKSTFPRYRGVVQIRGFWDAVREKLRFIDDDEEHNWPEGYPRESAECRFNASDALDDYLTSRWASMFPNSL